MIEMRWLEFGKVDSVGDQPYTAQKLQYRHRKNPDIMSMSIWSEWIDVPIVRE